jgi:hypothetical protein
MCSSNKITITVPGFYRISYSGLYYDAQTSMYAVRTYLYKNNGVIDQEMHIDHNITSIGEAGVMQKATITQYLYPGDYLELYFLCDTIDNGTVAAGGTASEKGFLELNMIGQ